MGGIFSSLKNHVLECIKSLKITDIWKDEKISKKLKGKQTLKGELNNSSKHKIREFYRDVDAEVRKPSPALRLYWLNLHLLVRIPVIWFLSPKEIRRTKLEEWCLKEYGGVFWLGSSNFTAGLIPAQGTFPYAMQTKCKKNFSK